jgi:hypothetical protein
MIDWLGAWKLCPGTHREDKRSIKWLT